MSNDDDEHDDENDEMMLQQQQQRLSQWIDHLSPNEMRGVLRYLLLLNMDAVQSAMRYVGRQSSPLSASSSAAAPALLSELASASSSWSSSSSPQRQRPKRGGRAESVGTPPLRRKSTIDEEALQDSFLMRQQQQQQQQQHHQPPPPPPSHSPTTNHHHHHHHRRPIDLSTSNHSTTQLVSNQTRHGDPSDPSPPPRSSSSSSTDNSAPVVETYNGTNRHSRCTTVSAATAAGEHLGGGTTGASSSFLSTPAGNNNNNNSNSNHTSEQRFVSGMVSFVLDDGNASSSSSSSSSSTPSSRNRKTLVILCRMKPNSQQAEDQDRSMTICRHVGLHPHILLEERDADKCQELLHVAASKGEGREGGSRFDTFPQFFLQHVQQVWYLGDYDRVEAMYTEGKFDTTLLKVSKSSKHERNNNGKRTRRPLDELLQSATELRVTRLGKQPVEVHSVTTNHSTASSTTAAAAAAEAAEAASLHEGTAVPPVATTTSTSHHHHHHRHRHHHLPNKSLQAHLQPLANTSTTMTTTTTATSNNQHQSRSEDVSLGDDLQAVFGTRAVGIKMERPHPDNGQQQQQPQQKVPASPIHEEPSEATETETEAMDDDDDDDDDEDKNGVVVVAPPFNEPTTTTLSANTPLITTNPEATQQRHQPQISASSNGTWTVRETVTLKPSSAKRGSPDVRQQQQQQQQSEQQRPAPEYTSARATLKPASERKVAPEQQKQQEQQQQPPPQPMKNLPAPKRNIVNPYYALPKYGGKAASNHFAGESNETAFVAPVMASANSAPTQPVVEQKQEKTVPTSTDAAPTVQTHRLPAWMQEHNQQETDAAPIVQTHQLPAWMQEHNQQETNSAPTVQTQQEPNQQETDAAPTVQTQQLPAWMQEPNQQETDTAPTAQTHQLPAWMKAYNQQEEQQQQSQRQQQEHHAHSSARSNADPQQGVERKKSWEKSFLGVGACYLVYDAVEGHLDLHYSEIPIIGAVGVWTTSDPEIMRQFKDAQGLGQSELIGNCAAHVTQDRQHYYNGWCQFVKAGKSLDATVTVLPDVGVPVDFYLYIKGVTIKVESESFETETIDAAACVAKNAAFPTNGVKGKKWIKTAKRLGGAVAAFAQLSSKDGERSVSHAESSNSMPLPSATPMRQSSAILEMPIPEDSPMVEQLAPSPVPVQRQTMSFPEQPLVQSQSSQPHPPVHQPPVPPPPQAPSLAINTAPDATSDGGYASALATPSPQGGACYLVYEPDSSGRLVEHYSHQPIEGSIGRWAPTEGSNKKIAGFKFKRNVGRNVLIGNCSAGVQGRKNYCSGWCQFVRSAKGMDAEVMLWDPVSKGMMVDVYLYYSDSRSTHQTQRLEGGKAYTTEGLLAVACIPKNTPFYEGMAVDMLKWLADGSSYGYSSKM